LVAGTDKKRPFPATCRDEIGPAPEVASDAQAEESRFLKYRGRWKLDLAPLGWPHIR
jgi:hypothetical protein